MEEPEPNEYYHADLKVPATFISNVNSAKELATPIETSDNCSIMVNNESTLELNKAMKITDRSENKEGECFES